MRQKNSKRYSKKNKSWFSISKKGTPFSNKTLSVFLLLVVLSGIFIVWVSNAAVIGPNNIEGVKNYSNLDQSVQTGGIKKQEVMVDVKRSEQFQNATGTASAFKKSSTALFESGTRINSTNYSSQTVNRSNPGFAEYSFKLPAGQYSICQFGMVRNDNPGASMYTTVGGQEVKPGDGISTQPSLTSFSELNSTNGAISGLDCTDVFRVVLAPGVSEGTIRYTVEVGITAVTTPAIIDGAPQPAQAFLSRFMIIKPKIQGFSEARLAEEFNPKTDCATLAQSVGARYIEGSISDKLGKPVPAQISIDYPGIADTNSSLYERVIYVNTTGRYDLTTRWCAVVPKDVTTAWVEVYSRDIKDSSKTLVFNNALYFGNSMYHNTKLVADNNGKVRLDLKLPNACGTPGLGVDIANTADIKVTTKINGTVINKSSDFTKVPRDSSVQNQPWRNIAFSGKRTSSDIPGLDAVSLDETRFGLADKLERLEPGQTYRVKTELKTNLWKYHLWANNVAVEPCQNTDLIYNITDTNPQAPPENNTVTACTYEVFVAGKFKYKLPCSSQNKGDIKIPLGVKKVDRNAVDYATYDFIQ